MHNKSLRHAFNATIFSGDVLYEEEGIDQLLMGLTVEPMQDSDAVFTKALSNFLFFDVGKKGGNFSGQDLVAINIMRGRDHGVPAYNDMREYCNLTRAATFAGLRDYMPDEVAARMAKVYKSVEDLDVYVSGIAEFSVYGGVVSVSFIFNIFLRKYCFLQPAGMFQVGPLFACLIAEQFYRSRRCDRFWYETNDAILRFSEGT